MGAGAAVSLLPSPVGGMDVVWASAKAAITALNRVAESNVLLRMLPPHSDELWAMILLSAR